MYGSGILLISTMSQSPPIDQRIVDEYFNLASRRSTRDVGWLLGMVATYGIQPEALENFDWGPDGTLILENKKRPIRPLHPQWVLLFSLDKKRPHKMWSRISPLSSHLYRLIAHQEISVNITDLTLAYSIRKQYYKPVKQQMPSAFPALVCAGIS